MLDLLYLLLNPNYIYFYLLNNLHKIRSVVKIIYIKQNKLFPVGYQKVKNVFTQSTAAQNGFEP